jgi:hypothetical protein
MTLKMPNLNAKFLKFLKDNMVTFLLLALVAYVMMNGNPVQAVKEAFTAEPAEVASGNGATPKEASGPGPSAKPQGPAPVVSTVKAHDDEEVEFAQVGAPEKQINVPSCAQFVSSNLLPKDDPKLDANFTEFSPAKDLQGQDFIDTNKYAVGMQSQSLRNANHQLRSDPPIANTMACKSPWNNTTINAEVRRPLTIGSSA